MTKTLTLDVPQLRLVTEGYLASQSAEQDEPAIGVIPPVIKSLLDQAQQQIGAAEFVLTLVPQQAAELREALTVQLDEAAESGDIFALGELQGILMQLERIEHA